MYNGRAPVGHGPGLVIVLLGILIWTDNRIQLTALHEVLAVTLVLALFGLAAIGTAFGLSRAIRTRATS